MTSTVLALTIVGLTFHALVVRQNIHIFIFASSGFIGYNIYT